MDTLVTQNGVVYTLNNGIDSISEYFSDDQLYHLQNTFKNNFLEYIENRLQHLLKTKVINKAESA